MPERPEPPALTRPGRFLHPWHVAINRVPYGQDMRFMYEAKTMADEVPRLAMRFQQEREGKLPTLHRQCSHAEPEPIPENYLTCCLGQRCSECPFLQALDAAELSDAERDQAKAWTCAAHIVSKGGDPAGEGYVLTVDDRMFWERTYANMAGGPPDDA